ncbi:CBS domain-containing protein [Pseudoflavonifractor sp. 524-17]|uniref:CBS domain-containing protein n=1 Tax=Pseudoflavonifractor sp. 524-17 TaxID=2304577 RepID=UPI00137B8C08|nr:CBS domain-containing protein [Pseudoflavonifractor sp. 524-17]NCE63932.1 CBS domain-containing protein [Pseudoflavonifractor sp. 524-17]
MLVRELMNPQVVTITPGESAALAARLLSRYDLGALPVCQNDGRLRGIVTDRDLVLRCLAPGENPERLPVGDVMTRSCAFVTPNADVTQAAHIMASAQVRRLPVVENQKVVGILSLGDLARSRACDMEAGAALADISREIRKASLNLGARGL